MLFRLKLLTLNIFLATLLIFFLCLGSQNLNTKHSINLLTSKTVPLPIGFLVGTAFTLGLISGGVTFVSLINNEN